MRWRPLLVGLALLPLGCVAGRPRCPTAPPTAERAVWALLEQDPRDLPEGWDRLAALLEGEDLASLLRHFVARSGLDRTVPAARLEQADRAAEMLAAQLCLRGALPACAGRAYEPDRVWAARVAARLDASPLARPRRHLEDPAFLAELEAIQGAPFLAADTILPLVDGPASWAWRRRLVAEARRTIHLATWALYDDRTGQDAVDALVGAARRGVVVRVVVDGRMAKIPPFVAATQRLLETVRREPELPLEVIAWGDADLPYAGQHRKLLLVDGEVAILGGMNYGDWYSHGNPAVARRWRDTDLLLRGAVVAEAERLFARLAPPSARAPRDHRAADAPPAPARAGRRAAIVDHVPGDDDPILASLLKAIDGARRSVELENAYVIRPPALARACADAVARGVRVRLLTNSLESLDEAILGYAVLRTAHEFAATGVEVYVKQGDTLHSKFALVDDEFAQVGSYNLHPRSRRLEGEVVANLLDPSAVAALRAAFEQDVAAARRVRGPADAPLPDDPLGRLAWRWFPDLL